MDSSGIEKSAIRRIFINEQLTTGSDFSQTQNAPVVIPAQAGIHC
jgi:hypothetical protein